MLRGVNMKVINFEEAKKKSEEKDVKYYTSPILCLKCKHEWEGVFPEGTIHLECPKCGLDFGTPMYHFDFNIEHWVCNCGNFTFNITLHGIYCPVCGVWQQFPYSIF